jgi:hypothetical protein
MLRSGCRPRELSVSSRSEFLGRKCDTYADRTNLLGSFEIVTTALGEPYRKAFI